MTKNKLAGFWIRFLAKGIDTIIIVIIMILMALPFLRLGEITEFKSIIGFYFWTIFVMLIWPFYFIGITFLTKGYTFGMWILALKIKSDGHLLLSIIKREIFFSLLFSFNFITIIIVINHTLINRFFQMDQKNIIYTTWENFRISIQTTISSVSMLLQMIVGISIIIKKGKGIHDIYSKSNIIYINKKIKMIEKNNLNKISKKYKPKLVEEIFIEWIK